MSASAHQPCAPGTAASCAGSSKTRFARAPARSGSRPSTPPGVPCGPILTVDATFEDPQVQHLQLAQTVHSPHFGDQQIVRSPTRLSRTSTSLRNAAPRAGADTEAVLAEYGYSADEIAELRNSGALAAAPAHVGGEQA